MGAALLPEGASFAYKYTRGTWDTVEKGPSGEELPNGTGLAAFPTLRRDRVERWASF